MERQMVSDHEAKLLSAIKNADTAVLDHLLHEDLLFNLPDGQTITKSDDLQVYRSGNMRVDSLEVMEQQINIIGDNAVVTVTIALTGCFSEHILDGKYRYIRVWKLFGNELKVIAGSCVLL